MIEDVNLFGASSIASIYNGRVQLNKISTKNAVVDKQLLPKPKGITWYPQKQHRHSVIACKQTADRHVNMPHLYNRPALLSTSNTHPRWKSFSQHNAVDGLEHGIDSLIPKNGKLKPMYLLKDGGVSSNIRTDHIQERTWISPGNHDHVSQDHVDNNVACRSDFYAASTYLCSAPSKGSCLTSAHFLSQESKVKLPDTKERIKRKVNNVDIETIPVSNLLDWTRQQLHNESVKRFRKKGKKFETFAKEREKKITNEWLQLRIMELKMELEYLEALLSSNIRIPSKKGNNITSLLKLGQRDLGKLSNCWDG